VQCCESLAWVTSTCNFIAITLLCPPLPVAFFIPMPFQDENNNNNF
jgi:hypothetical protein